MRVTITIDCEDTLDLEKLIPANKSIRKIDYVVEKSKGSRHGEVTADLVAIWNTLTKSTVTVTVGRTSKVRSRLDDGFTAEQLMEVVTKLAKSEFHNGQNDRQWSVPGPEWVLHSIERVQQWLRKTDKGTETYADQVKKFF